MPVDPRKRQKKLARRNARHKAYKKEIAVARSTGLATLLRDDAGAPILHCCVADTIWEQGIGSVLVSRVFNTGDVAFTLFLLDVYCLGVKDVTMGIKPRRQYDQDIYQRLQESPYPLTQFSTACARKLVEGAVAFARRYGLAPHPDYQKAKLIFGDVDVSECAQAFAYGVDGKPCFIAGPHDGPARSRQIMNALSRHAPPGEFDFVAPVSRETFLELTNEPARFQDLEDAEDK